AGKLNVRVGAGQPDDMIHLRTTARLSFGDWHHIALAYDGRAEAVGTRLRLFVDGEPAGGEIIKESLKGTCANDAGLPIGSKPFGQPFKGQLDDLRLYRRTLSEADIAYLAIRYPVMVILSGVNGKRTKDEAERVRDYFLTYAASDAQRQQYKELKSLRGQKQ